MDAQAALECLQSRTDIDSSRIVLFGRSLGGAVAIHLAADNKDKVCCATWWFMPSMSIGSTDADM